MEVQIRGKGVGKNLELQIMHVQKEQDYSQNNSKHAFLHRIRRTRLLSEGSY